MGARLRRVVAGREPTGRGRQRSRCSASRIGLLVTATARCGSWPAGGSTPSTSSRPTTSPTPVSTGCEPWPAPWMHLHMVGLAAARALPSPSGHRSPPRLRPRYVASASPTLELIDADPVPEPLLVRHPRGRAPGHRAARAPRTGASTPSTWPAVVARLSRSVPVVRRVDAARPARGRSTSSPGSPSSTATGCFRGPADAACGWLGPHPRARSSAPWLD